MAAMVAILKVDVRMITLERLNGFFKNLVDVWYLLRACSSSKMGMIQKQIWPPGSHFEKRDFECWVYNVITLLDCIKTLYVHIRHQGCVYFLKQGHLKNKYGRHTAILDKLCPS